jgi:SAM-dependent methyltransferase
MRKERKIAENVRMPLGRYGRKVAKDMNVHHESLARWGLTFVNIEEDYQILDIGCGGGRNINRFAKLIHDGKVFGIDYSDTSIKVSSELNEEYIDIGLVEIKKGSVSAIPYDDNKFDLVTAFETYYFWPDLKNDLKEVLRVMKGEASFLLVNELYECENPKKMKNSRKWARLCNIELHNPDQFEQLLTEAGFSEIRIHENVEEGWITAVASKKSSN